MTVDGAGFRGIIITDTDKTDGKLEIINGSTVTLTDCCNTDDSRYTDTYSDGVAVKMNKDATKQVAFTVDEGSKLDAGRCEYHAEHQRQQHQHHGWYHCW